jgi:hypothetical protein
MSPFFLLKTCSSCIVLTSIVEATKLQDLPLNPPKLLIFGESKEEALIYILTEAIYFPLTFA